MIQKQQTEIDSLKKEIQELKETAGDGCQDKDW